jgi:hypothetical protein
LLAVVAVAVTMAVAAQVVTEQMSLEQHLAVALVLKESFLLQQVLPTQLQLVRVALLAQRQHLEQG